ncbi:sigma-70 family RNA polymerase sigma factor [Luteococcus peritonei]
MVGPQPVTAARRSSADDLAVRLRAGDAAAMADLYDRFGDRIYNYCYRRTVSWSEAEDLTSEVFLTAWRIHHKAHGSPEELLCWLYAIATNLLRNHDRSRRRGHAAVLRLDPPAEAAPADEVVERMSADERVRAALDRLADFPRSHQDVFWLVTWEGLTYEQVAAALDCPVGTVRSRLSRVRQALRLTDEAVR